MKYHFLFLGLAAFSSGLLLAGEAPMPAAPPATNPATSSATEPHRITILVTTRPDEKTPRYSVNGQDTKPDDLAAALRHARPTPTTHPASTLPGTAAPTQPNPSEDISCDIDLPPNLSYVDLAFVMIACAKADYHGFHIAIDHQHIVNVILPKLDKLPAQGEPGPAAAWGDPLPANVPGTPKPTPYRMTLMMRMLTDKVTVTFRDQNLDSPASLATVLKESRLPKDLVVIIHPNGRIAAADVLAYAKVLETAKINFAFSPPR